MMHKITLTSLFMIGMVGCQSLPPSKEPATKITPPQEVKPKEIKTPTGVVIKPYEPEEIQRRPVQPVVVIPKQPIQSQHFDDGSNLPAVKNLIQQAENALKQQQIDRAETLTLQAQRLAPQSAETYLILAKIALLKNNKSSANSLAQRGLSFAQDENIKKQLNTVIQQAR